MDPSKQPSHASTSSKTPLRCLGLRRSRTGATPNASVSGPELHKTPIQPAESVTPQLKVDQLNAARTECLPRTTSDLTDTPASAETSATPVQSLSTGGPVRRRYRLSLNSHIRDKFSRKRLIFAASQQQSSDQSPVVPAQPVQPPPIEEPPVDCDLDELRRMIATESAELEAAQKHAAETDRIRADIAVWEMGFRRSFGMLQSLVDPPHNTAEALLRMLNIPEDLVKDLEQ